MIILHLHAREPQPLGRLLSTVHMSTLADSKASLVTLQQDMPTGDEALARLHKTLSQCYSNKLANAQPFLCHFQIFLPAFRTCRRAARRWRDCARRWSRRSLTSCRRPPSLTLRPPLSRPCRSASSRCARPGAKYNCLIQVCKCQISFEKLGARAKLNIATSPEPPVSVSQQQLRAPRHHKQATSFWICDNPADLLSS